MLHSHNRPKNGMPPMERAALTIAGSDSCGGAGIQADLKTFARFGIHGACAITAVTSQNTLGVGGVSSMDPAFVAEQIRRVLDDLPVTAAKTGMLSNRHIIEAIVQVWPEQCRPHLVVDPVMVATSGARLLDESALESLRTGLLPLASLVTPNLPEARILAGIRDPADAPDTTPAELARIILGTGCAAVLIKDGHGTGEVVEDRLFTAGDEWVFRHPRHPGQFHGTGCTLSAAITALLGSGDDLVHSVEESIDWLAWLIGRARAPLKGSLGILPVETATPPAGRQNRHNPAGDS